MPRPAAGCSSARSVRHHHAGRNCLCARRLFPGHRWGRAPEGGLLTETDAKTPSCRDSPLKGEEEDAGSDDRQRGGRVRRPVPRGRAEECSQVRESSACILRTAFGRTSASGLVFGCGRSVTGVRNRRQLPKRMPRRAATLQILPTFWSRKRVGSAPHRTIRSSWCDRHWPTWMGKNGCMGDLKKRRRKVEKSSSIDGCNSEGERPREKKIGRCDQVKLRPAPTIRESPRTDAAGVTCAYGRTEGIDRVSGPENGERGSPWGNTCVIPAS